MQLRNIQSIYNIIKIIFSIVFPTYIFAGVMYYYVNGEEPSKFFINESGDLTNVFGIWVGAMTGAILSLLFFWLGIKWSKTQENTEQIMADLKKIKGTYTVRTSLWNLYDIFSGKAGRVQPNEKNKKIFVDLLNDFIKDNKIGNKDEIYQIWSEAYQHDEIPQTEHSTKECDVCKQLSKMQQEHFGTIFKHQHDCPKCKSLSERIMKYLDDPDNKNKFQMDGQ